MINRCFNPDVTREIALGAKQYIVNDKYYLLHFSDWDEQIGEWLAEKEMIKLSSEHMYIIEFLRKSYIQYKRHPVIRMVTTEMSKTYGADKSTMKYFHTLFPGGIHQAFLVAGLPMQDSCC